MRKTGIAAALLLLGLSQAALAENKAETVTFAPYVGGYTFQGNQHVETSPVFGFRLGYNLTDNWALEGVVDYLKADLEGGGDMEMLRYGGDILYNIMPKSSLVPYLAAGFGGFTIDNSKTRGIVNYGGGLKWFLSDNFALRADVRGLNYSMGKIYTNVEYTLGLHVAVGAPKPAPAPVVVAEPVVEAAAPKAAPVVVAPPPPPPPAPTSSLMAEPATLEKGKTTTLTWSSTNTSGCDIQPGIGPVSATGSTVITPAANTKYTLTCSGEGGKTTSSAGVEVTEPVKEESAKKASAVAAGTRLSLKVNFDTGKSVIKKQYYDELKVVGDGLNEQKNLKGVIEGHTDNVGSDKSNLALSQRRANAVRDYIVKNFKIDRKRLAAKGYGESKPIADNATAEGREQNRRIEAVFEEIPNFKPDADEQQPVKPAKKAVKKKTAKKKPAKQ
ncbi:outer membrane beta-barrel domain-containing protein [Trichlorobacter lovleyi]|uniref:OmpA family protein n=1 Tax=Trichlorobacter lovleyi TaxID=313985 RepID=UPI00223EEDC0|nr:OmpA family protein [Trichlorobacter lovleyi]QOX77929.1 outer membrane beta-barrel domain-containing protein [Trichlorobacter lovleyi]